MKENRTKFFFGFGGVVLGVILTLTAFSVFPQWQHRLARPSAASRQMEVWNDFHQNQKQMMEHFDRMFREGVDEDLFKDEDPLKSFRSLQIGESDGPGVGELSQREDGKYVYFDLEVDDLKSTSIQSKIENGYLTVSGVVEKKSQDEGFEKVMKSEFHRTFPLPQNIDSKKMEVVSEGHKVTFKFPKV
jgi:HSP20 family molecular chaperone IbpA